MKLRILAASLLLFLLCGCGVKREEPASLPVAAQTVTQVELDRVLDCQLGLLRDKITRDERAQAMGFLEKLWPMREERLQSGAYQRSQEEIHLAERLNQIYERLTVRYLGDEEDWGYDDPPARTLAEYRLEDGRPAAGRAILPEHLALWEQMTALLPEGAFDEFSRFVVFTDGPDETLAYVNIPTRDSGQWEIAVDPADAGDGAWFQETIIHEYCHYLTLNTEQMDYTARLTTDTYYEDGMQAHPDSYLDEFYQSFWSELLDDRLADPASFYFFFRHEDAFYNPYASTDPTEDLAESFTYFVVLPPQSGEEMWVEKLNFFYDYPELVEFRREVRSRMGLELE